MQHTTSTIVFAGPSIDEASVCERIVAKVVGPIRRGDLKQAREYRIVVIIDGEFGQSLSVSPKEILAAIDCGAIVIGASSMGALRASELDAFGMLGVGWIYKRFRKAEVRRDDEVALLFCPITNRPLTVPMVDILYWVEVLFAGDTITVQEGHKIEAAARSIHFADRSWTALHNLLTSRFGGARVNELLQATGGRVPDIKSIDAAQAIDVAIAKGAARAVGE